VAEVKFAPQLARWPLLVALNHDHQERCTHILGKATAVSHILTPFVHHLFSRRQGEPWVGKQESKPVVTDHTNDPPDSHRSSIVHVTTHACSIVLAMDAQH
jgi:hypothetical protein